MQRSSNLVVNVANNKHESGSAVVRRKRTTCSRHWRCGMALFVPFFQLHNQIEDMKGQTRMYARVRPMDALEKEAGCKEVSTDPSNLERLVPCLPTRSGENPTKKHLASRSCKYARVHSPTTTGCMSMRLISLARRPELLPVFQHAVRSHRMCLVPPFH